MKQQLLVDCLAYICTGKDYAFVNPVVDKRHFETFYSEAGLITLKLEHWKMWVVSISVQDAPLKSIHSNPQSQYTSKKAI